MSIKVIEMIHSLFQYKKGSPVKPREAIINTALFPYSDKSVNYSWLSTGYVDKYSYFI